MTDKIINALKSVPCNIPQNEGDTVWTRAVKQVLGDLGRNMGFQVCAGGMGEEFESEWLYDLIWYSENDEGCLCSVPLVVESEWGRQYKEIKLDFEKLLLARSQRKVMIFQATGDVKIEYFKKLRRGIDSFCAENISETYILACFDESTYQFEFDVITKDK